MGPQVSKSGELSEIRIYVNFPTVQKYLGDDLNGASTAEGKVMLSELVDEAFCKELARTGIESGKYPVIPGSEIDTFNSVVNELQKKYLLRIYEMVTSWKSK
jgi:hypothetical protein